jgi:hypothetical protein
MERVFPSRKGLIDAVKTHTDTCFLFTPLRYQQPLTIDEGGSSYPTVICPYSGGADELITMAHEFSHALQIMSSKGRKSPPILREICAFIGELALLEYMKEKDLDQYNILFEAWNSQNAGYFGSNLKDLKIALSVTNSGYNYQWNYPIARVMAIDLFRNEESSKLWNLFQRGIESSTYRDYLKGLEGAMNEVALSALNPNSGFTPLITSYSVIGVLAMLDILYQGHNTKRKIRNYVSDLKIDLTSECIYLQFNSSRQPIGYCKYVVESSSAGVKRYVSQREILPFGRQRHFQASFRRKFESLGEVEVLHEK